MATTITIDPVTRIEGHLEIQVTVDSVGGTQQVVEAKSAGTMFRGFEIILAGRDPRDAVPYTQRICGVCPVSHATAACLALDNAFEVAVPDNGRILRNLVLGANFIQSHLLHFYHLSALDFVNTTGILDASPWSPRYTSPDMLTGQAASNLVANYLTALQMRRKAHQAGAIFAGKLPCIASFTVGGCTETVTAKKVADFRALLTELRSFIDNTYVADAQMLGTSFADYYQLGIGNGNMLAFGVFDLDSSGTNRLFGAGRRTDGVTQSIDVGQISEYVTHSWYTSASGGLNPAVGVTEPDATKLNAYTWMKAPRYLNKVHEAGPLARMWLSGRYTNGVSVMDRIVARALETKVIADAMDGWLDQLVVGGPVYQSSSVPQTATGVGLTEAPRGALGHWLSINDSVVSRYQVITPTNWNASPRDNLDQPGSLEEALVGTPVADTNQPSEVLRVVHSFDPCLACAVHMVRPGQKVGSRVLIRPSVG